MMLQSTAPLLSIENLHLTIGETEILKGISLTMEQGKILGLVGESGSGKSMTALSIMQLLPHGSRTEGALTFDGRNILTEPEDAMCALRGDDLAMIFQEPMTALNPVKTIGAQVSEGIRLHRKVSRSNAEKQAANILDRVGLPPSRIPLSRYPFELSGGQRQRVMIAMACAMRPKLLIADEPTTALDVSVQARILELLRDLVDDFGMGLMLITHDLGVVAEMADDLCVLRDGEIMEQGSAIDVLSHQKHPYTAQLAEASTHQPQKNKTHALTDQPLVQVDQLTCTYPGTRKHIFHKPKPFVAVKDLSLQIAPGEIMGLVGESGCGKSTLARTLLGLNTQSSGTITFDGKLIDPIDKSSVIVARREMGMVFQDPYGSFNPRHKVGRIVSEPLHLMSSLSRSEATARVSKALIAVGLESDDANKFPHEFSGGQRQRIAIARALITEPKLIIADEPVSALDVSIRAQVLDLLVDLNERLGLAYLFISHDLSVVRAFCDRVAVMNAGSIVELGDAKAIFETPHDEYTKMLIAAAPDLKTALSRRIGEASKA